jgi:hypothetical protein
LSIAESGPASASLAFAETKAPPTPTAPTALTSPAATQSDRTATNPPLLSATANPVSLPTAGTQTQPTAAAPISRPIQTSVDPAVQAKENLPGKPGSAAIATAAVNNARMGELTSSATLRSVGEEKGAGSGSGSGSGSGQPVPAGVHVAGDASARGMLSNEAVAQPALPSGGVGGVGGAAGSRKRPAAALETGGLRDRK